MQKEQEILAVISAAVAAMEKAGNTKLIVKAYRRIPQTCPIWNSIGRSENSKIKQN
jgi:hypothetical protein